MKYTILYVDDEVDNLYSFKSLFRRDYNILIAESGEQAIQMLEDNEVDLIISDQRMPQMTGVELFEAIKDQYPDVLRMVMTGYSDMQAVIDSINKGRVYQYISKPWDEEDLKRTLDNALETYSLRKRNRELEKENILAQFDILKHQINPHFLFNSMNILAALIPIDQEKAVAFTSKFSKLYRSVLELKEQMLINLEEELEFAKDYIYLQKVRFGENLQIEFDIPESHLNDAIPPFALQLLLENAIKHNIVSMDQPLKIRVAYEADKLVVENNLQKRKNVQDSTGIGLKNLQARYQLICEDCIETGEQGEKFVAKIPLIPSA